MKTRLTFAAVLIALAAGAETAKANALLEIVNKLK